MIFSILSTRHARLDLKLVVPLARREFSRRHIVASERWRFGEVRRCVRSDLSQFAPLTLPLSLSAVLEGAFLVPSDIVDTARLPPLDTLSYGIASLYLGLLFKAPVEEIRRRAALIYRHRASVTGTILQPFYNIIMATASIVTQDLTRLKEVDDTDTWLAAFSNSKSLVKVWWNEIDPINFQIGISWRFGNSFVPCNPSGNARIPQMNQTAGLVA